MLPQQFKTACHGAAIIIIIMQCSVLDAQQHLPSPPAHIFQFELADAAVPNKETHHIIQQGRARSLQQEQQQQHEATAMTTSTPPAIATSTGQRISTRTSRQPAAQQHHSQRHGRKTSSQLPVDDMSTDESRMVHIRVPMSAAKGRKIEASSGKMMRTVKQFPMEVR